MPTGKEGNQVQSKLNMVEQSDTSIFYNWIFQLRCYPYSTNHILNPMPLRSWTFTDDNTACTWTYSELQYPSSLIFTLVTYNNRQTYNWFSCPNYLNRYKSVIITAMVHHSIVRPMFLLGIAHPCLWMIFLYYFCYYHWCVQRWVRAQMFRLHFRATLWS